MGVDTLAPCFAKSSAAMVLSMQGECVLVLHEVGFQQHAISVLGNLDTFSWFLKRQYDKLNAWLAKKYILYVTFICAGISKVCVYKHKLQSVATTLPDHSYPIRLQKYYLPLYTLPTQQTDMDVASDHKDLYKLQASFSTPCAIDMPWQMYLGGYGVWNRRLYQQRHQNYFKSYKKVNNSCACQLCDRSGWQSYSWWETNIAPH